LPKLNRHYHTKRQEEQISTQNEALTRIAIIQSHELRRPVASLLGIMDLMKLEHIDFGYFKYHGSYRK